MSRRREELPDAPPPSDAEALERAMEQTQARLRDRGIALTGEESSGELASLLEAVEFFELAVEGQGGDLMVDEAPGGETREPDDPHFVLPRRRPGETVRGYLRRLETRTREVRRHRPHAGPQP